VPAAHVDLVPQEELDAVHPVDDELVHGLELRVERQHVR
jgi:hypothetical protein